MTTRKHDPRRLDVAAAAAACATLKGRWRLSELPRLADDATARVDEPVEWSARFERRDVRGAPKDHLYLRAEARVARECQRCLQPVLLALRVDRAFAFVATEDEAEALDAESDDDVLTLSRHFDLRALIEDELLMALPFVPKHEQCPVSLLPDLAAAPTGADEITQDHPFAGLAALRRSGGR